MKEGRLIIDPAGDGIWNMAVDAGLYNAAQADIAFRPTLRIYSWNPPCVSLGRSQDFSVADLDFCKERGIDVVKRIGGGSAVFHQTDVTYSFITRLDSMEEPSAAEWRVFFLKVLKALGVEGDGSNEEDDDKEKHTACFAAAGKDEPTVKGKKWVGSARRRSRSVFLQHGSMLLDPQPAELERILKGESVGNSTGLRELRPEIDRKSVIEGMKSSMKETFGLSLVEAGYTPLEMSEAKKLLQSGKAP